VQQSLGLDAASRVADPQRDRGGMTLRGE
jgi:hypothetical protein